jgi:hypothetical protein
MKPYIKYLIVVGILIAAFFIYKSISFAAPGWGGTFWYRECNNGKVEYSKWPIVTCYDKGKQNTNGKVQWSARCNGNGIIFYTNKSKNLGSVRCVNFPYKKGITMMINEIEYSFNPVTKKLVKNK